MATNLALDDKLIMEAQKLGHFKTKRDTVTQALKEFIMKRKQRDLVKLFGTVDFDAGYDYKKQRRIP